MVINNLDVEHLENISYYEVLNKIQKVKKNIRTVLMRDVNELFLNQIMGNSKAVVILSRFNCRNLTDLLL